MIKSNHSKYKKPAVMLYPGEHFVSNDDIVISTVSGQCIVVTLFDRFRKIGGVGHFIVPGQIGTESIAKSEIAAYGITQLEYIFGEIVKLGGNRRDLTASAFGASTLNTNPRINEQILTSNIRFIHEFFQGEKIPVEHLDISGSMRRKIVFFPHTGKTFRKILTNNEQGSEIIRLENEYIAQAFAALSRKTEFVLFNGKRK